MAATTKPKQTNRALTSAERTQGLIWYVNGGWELQRIASALGVNPSRVFEASEQGGWGEARALARSLLVQAAKDYAKGLADVQRQVCEDDLKVGDRLARISAKLIEALDATLAEMDAEDAKGASACEWRLSRLATAWERVQKARRLAVGLNTDKTVVDSGLGDDIATLRAVLRGEDDPGGSDGPMDGLQAAQPTESHPSLP
jgi:hypothetical protein